MKNKYLILLTSLLVLFVVSCGKETQSSTQGGGKLVLKLTSLPANNTEAIAVHNLFSTGTSSKFYFPVKNTGEVKTDTFNVTTGQNFPIIIYGGVTTSCSNIVLEAFLNGKLYKTKSFNVGGNAINIFGGPSDICDYPATNLTSGPSGIPYNITID